MNCCGSSSDSYKHVNLKTMKLEEIKLKINGGTLTFDSEVGVFRQSENFNVSTNTKGYSVKKAQIEELELLIKSRLEEKARLINDIKMVSDNKDKITNLLKVDLEDKSFMEEIKDNFQNYKNMLSESVDNRDNNTHLTNDNSIIVTNKDKDNQNQSAYLDTINNVNSALTNQNEEQ